MAPSPLLEKVRACIRVRHYSPRTESAYVHWIRRYILFHGKRHPAEMGSAEVREFLDYLAVQKKVAASTQNQALAAVLFADLFCPPAQLMKLVRHQIEHARAVAPAHLL